MTSSPPLPRTRAFVVPFVACIVVILAVIIFGLIVAKGASYTADETYYLRSVAGSRSTLLVDISLAVDRIFSPSFAALIGVIAAVVVFVVSRKLTTVIHFGLLVAGTWLGSEVVKVIVHRPRPAARLADTLVPNPDPDSYPSGHVCFALALGFAIFVIVARSRLRAVIAVLAVILAVGTAATRVYLGVHYPTDAIASLVYSAAAFLAIELVWRQFSPQVFRDRRRH